MTVFWRDRGNVANDRSDHGRLDNRPSRSHRPPQVTAIAYFSADNSSASPGDPVSLTYDAEARELNLRTVRNGFIFIFIRFIVILLNFILFVVVQLDVIRFVFIQLFVIHLVVI